MGKGTRIVSTLKALDKVPTRSERSFRAHLLWVRSHYLPFLFGTSPNSIQKLWGILWTPETRFRKLEGLPSSIILQKMCTNSRYTLWKYLCRLLNWTILTWCVRSNGLSPFFSINCRGCQRLFLWCISESYGAMDLQRRNFLKTFPLRFWGFRFNRCFWISSGGKDTYCCCRSKTLIWAVFSECLPSFRRFPLAFLFFLLSLVNA